MKSYIDYETLAGHSYAVAGSFRSRSVMLRCEDHRVPGDTLRKNAKSSVDVLGIINELKQAGLVKRISEEEYMAQLRKRHGDSRKTAGNKK